MVTWDYNDLSPYLKAQVDKQERKAKQTPTPIAKKPKKSKYGNVKVVIDGHTFASKKESERYLYLKSSQQQGWISKLKLQPKFILQEKFTDRTGKKHQEIAYVADFKYLDGDGKDIVEDVKGYINQVYALKKKMLLFKYPDIIFRET